MLQLYFESKQGQFLFSHYYMNFIRLYQIHSLLYCRYVYQQITPICYMHVQGKLQTKYCAFLYCPFYLFLVSAVLVL